MTWHRSRPILVVAAFLLVSLSPAGSAQEPTAPERLLVAFTGTLSDVGDRFHGADVLERFASTDVLVVSATPAEADAIRADPRVRLVERDQPIRIATAPNDPKYPQQWAPGAIQAPDAWAVTPGTASIKVAVLDTGFDSDHPDRPTELVMEWDYGDDDNDPEDRDGHGTWVAGIIAAARDNGLGVAGLASVEILIIKVFQDDGTGYTSDLDAGINRAIQSGAHIVSMSLGFDSFSAQVENRVQNAADNGLLLVAAAGNNEGGAVMYPARYEQVIGVSSVREDLELAAHSSVGSAVELAAPGHYVKGLQRGGGYGSASGTSGAAPHVSAAAALLWSMVPELEASTIRNALQTTASDLGDPGRDHSFGYGLVQMYDALTTAFDRLHGESISDPETLVVDEGAEVTMHAASVPVGARAFAWDLDGDDLRDDADGVVVTWVPPDDGEWTTAMDYESVSGAGTHKRAVSVRNVAPTITAIQGPTDAPIGQPFTLTVQAHDPADPISFRADWGDGTSSDATGNTLTHTFAAAGTYDIIITADDGDGGETQARHRIRIGDDFRFATDSLRVTPRSLTESSPSLPQVDHPTKYDVSVDVVLEVGGPRVGVPIDLWLRKGSFSERFARIEVNVEAAGTHVIPIVAELDMTTQWPTGQYQVEAWVDAAHAFPERVETNNVDMARFVHLYD